MKIEGPLKKEAPMSAVNTDGSPDLGALFDGHVAREFADQDINATMETMVPEPYVHCVPVMTGGFGGQEVRDFYIEHFVNQIHKDAKITPISRAIGKDQVVDEFIVSFTHDTQWTICFPESLPQERESNLGTWWS